jgi:hypothetical protein
MYKTGILFWGFVLISASFFCGVLQAEDDSSWYHIPVIVNIASGCDANDAQIKAMIAEANRILHKAKIHFYIEDVNSNYKVGNGNSTFNGTEENQAIDDGEKEVGAGKGMKITIGDTISTIDNPLGIAKHRRPVALIKDTNDGEDMGKTLAHEFCHTLTLNYDLSDANGPDFRYNLMWEDDTYNGEELNDEQIKEIRKQAKKWGEKSIEPLPENPMPSPPGRPVQTTFGGYRTKNVGWGIVLDDGNDTPIIIFEPVVPRMHDFRWTEVFSDAPGAPDSNVSVGILVQGLLQTNYDYSITYNIQFDANSDGIADVIIDIPIMNVNGQLMYNDAIVNAVGFPVSHVPIKISTHYKFRDYGGGIEAVSEASYSAIDIEIPSIQFKTFPGGVFNVPCRARAISTLTIGANSAIDETQWFNIVSRSGSVPEDHIGVIYFAPPNPGDPCNLCMLPSYQIRGQGFIGDVEVFVNGRFTGTAICLADGTFSYVLTPEMMTLGEQFVEAIGTDPGGTKKRVFSYFVSKEPIKGDINGDYLVDMQDFAIMAGNWLSSVP